MGCASSKKPSTANKSLPRSPKQSNKPVVAERKIAELPKPEQVEVPEFEYVFTNQQLHLKYLGEKLRKPTTIPLGGDKELARNALVAFIREKVYLVAGGVSPADNQSRSNNTYLVDFNAPGRIERYKPCKYNLLHGMMYCFRSKAYIVGALREVEPIEVVRDDIDVLFPDSDQSILIEEQTSVDICPILELTLDPSQEWKEVKFERAMLEGSCSVFPDQLYLPGSCLVSHKLFFFLGKKKVRNEWVCNSEILCFDLERRKVALCLVRMPTKHVILHPAVALVRERELLILGGHAETLNKECMVEGRVCQECAGKGCVVREPQQQVFLYTIDKAIQGLADLPERLDALDSFQPCGVNGVAVVFRYPEAIVYDIKVEAMRKLDIKTYNANYQEDEMRMHN